MSNPQIITPEGLKVRSQSNRAYVLISVFEGRQDKQLHACIEKRSDKVNVLTEFVARERRNGRMRGCKAYVFSLRSGTMLRVLDAKTNRYRVIYSTSRGGFSEFSAADDRAAWAQAENEAYGARIIQLMEVRSGNPDHVRMLEKI